MPRKKNCRYFNDRTFEKLVIAKNITQTNKYNFFPKVYQNFNFAIVSLISPLIFNFNGVKVTTIMIVTTVTFSLNYV